MANSDLWIWALWIILIVGIILAVIKWWNEANIYQKIFVIVVVIVLLVVLILYLL